MLMLLGSHLNHTAILCYFHKNWLVGIFFFLEGDGGGVGRGGGGSRGFKLKLKTAFWPQLKWHRDHKLICSALHTSH